MSRIMKTEKQPIEKKQNQKLHHFSHRHPLELSHLHQEDNAVCSGCEHDILGPAYICTKPECAFLLHDLCFDLPRHLRHRSHPNHSLVLHSPPPYTDREFTCNACGESGNAFTYHCDTCKFDLHVECASLPEFEIRRDHKHPLMLLCGFTDISKGEGLGGDDDHDDYVCYVCDGTVGKGCWMYSCLACNCGAHLDCIAEDSYTI
ncbi:hypothetical protein OROHE_005360 [Orobanche hederae]